MSAVASLMLFSRFWDAINDPIIGGLCDKTKTHWGRYRPWLLFGAPLTALILILTFWAHPEWNDTGKIFTWQLLTVYWYWDIPVSTFRTEPFVEP